MSCKFVIVSISPTTFVFGACDQPRTVPNLLCPGPVLYTDAELTPPAAGPEMGEPVDTDEVIEDVMDEETTEPEVEEEPVVEEKKPKKVGHPRGV